MQFKLPRKISTEQAAIVQQHLSAIADAITDVQPENLVAQIDPKLICKNTILLSIGKQAIDFAWAFANHAKIEIPHVFIAQIKGYETKKTLPGWNLFWQTHPIPDEKTIQQSEQILDMLDALIIANPKLKLHVLVSGGASAAFAIPEPGISNTAYIEIITQAYIAGKNIDELNQIRSFFDCIKGGKLAARYPETDIYAWIISDVVTDDPRIIGSGPTVPGLEISTSTKSWITEQLQQIEIEIPIEHLFEMQHLASTTERAGKLQNTIVGTRLLLLQQLQTYLSTNGINYKIINTDIREPIETVAEFMLKSFETYKYETITLLFTGEPTVQVSEKALRTGKGGRVSALAVLLATQLEDEENCIFCGIATDGKDGTAPDPGYVVTASTAKHIRPLGGYNKLLKDGTTGKILSSLGYGLHFKQTGINYMDIYLLIIHQ